MDRRALLSSVAVALSVSGCTDNDSPSRSDGPPNHTERTTTNPTDPDPSTDSCAWPDMCEGTKLVELTVSSEFSDPVVLDAGCRDGTRTVPPGEAVSLTRRTDAESCDFRLTVDGEELFDSSVSGSETYSVTVESDGELKTSVAVL